MPEPTNPVQEPQTIIGIRPFKAGWQCDEGSGVGPYWIGDNAKQSAIDYAKGRAKFGHGEIPPAHAGRVDRERNPPFMPRARGMSVHDQWRVSAKIGVARGTSVLPPIV